MKLVSFTVKRYRSIIDANKLPLGDLTILVGPNNEGKSNLLRALVTALQIVSMGDRWRFFRGRGSQFRLARDVKIGDYSWEADFPVQLRETMPEGKSAFTLEFDLDAKERVAFAAALGSNLSGNLRVQLEIGANENVTFDVILQGQAKKRLTENREKLARFLGENLEVRYIPSVRTAESATDIINSIVYRELSILDKEPRYQTLQKEIRNLQEPILRQVGEGVRATLSEFMPEVVDVRLELPEASQRGRIHGPSCRVIVNDGFPTDLEMKGDGIQSLAAIALIRSASQTIAGGKSLMLAIEEPESHLHPQAIHRLRPVLAEISKKHQVVISTHSPIIVDRERIASTIIVKGSKAKPARGLADVRGALGVRISDNLTTADLVLLAEGPEDVQLLRSWLAGSSDVLAKALADGRLAFDSLGGASNLSYNAGHYKNLICRVHAFLDADQAANQAVEKALADHTLDLVEIHQSKCLGYAEAEIEDLIDLSSYSDEIKFRHGVELDRPEFRSTRMKWSRRLKNELRSQGKPDDEMAVGTVQLDVHAIAVQKGAACLHPTHRESFDAFARALEKRIAP